MKILITGATGFVGRRLCQVLSEGGHTLSAFSRDPWAAQRRVPALQQVFQWDSAVAPPPKETFEEVDAVINLAGATIAGRWTTAKKRAIRESRVLGTRHLVAGIERCAKRPKVLISTSAVGYYGDQGEKLVTEESPPGSDFLAQICREWEVEAARAEELGLRVVRLRISTVLGPKGGALQALLPLFKWGLGGPLGSGRQWWPWIHRDDLVGLILYTLQNDLSGPINAAAPQPVRQKEFAQTLGRILRRPTVFPAPSLGLRVVLGKFASTLLASTRAVPKRAQEAGYQFRFPELEAALRDALGIKKL